MLPSASAGLASQIQGSTEILLLQVCIAVPHDACIVSDISSCCSTVMASVGKRKGLLVFCSPESPELSELRKLPPELEVVAMGKTEAELSGETLRLLTLASVSNSCLATGANLQGVAMHPLKALCCLVMHKATEQKCRLNEPEASSTAPVQASPSSSGAALRWCCAAASRTARARPQSCRQVHAHPG